jgi:hypothetical protein
MIEKYYAAHIKTNLDATTITSAAKAKEKVDSARKTEVYIPFRCLYDR